MKISVQWLSDYVAIAEPARKVAERLTMAGLEVEGISDPGSALEGVVVAQIVERADHPSADKLSVTQVELGTGGRLQVVCGAKNFKIGDKVPLAKIGVRLPGGLEIRKALLRGVESEGMLCSAKELGISEDGSGLLVLSSEAKVGSPIAQALGLTDVVFEVNVTPNRPDALSHLGIAREISALTGKPLEPPKPPARGEVSPKLAQLVRIDLQDSTGCLRYAARVVEGVTVRPSPPWLAQRLTACGARSINNVVDVTNFVLFELGQPLHAFDFDRIAGGRIVVRRARSGELLTTLDGKERRLDPEDLVIADVERPLVLAGVMGGAAAEVSQKTQRVLIESATFQPSSIRRSSRRHGLHTDSSHRFERGTDVEAVLLALDRATALIAELSDGTALPGAIDAYPKPVPRRRVEVRFEKVEALLGASVPDQEGEAILGALGFSPVKRDDRSVTFEVPSARVDIEREEDLIEEIARIRGYERIPSAVPPLSAAPPKEKPQVELERRSRAALASCGMNEAINYSFSSELRVGWTAPGPLEQLGKLEQPIRLSNPLSAEQSVMRQSLFGGLLENLRHNLDRQAQSVRLYEVGRTYLPDPEGDHEKRAPAIERLKIAGLLFGRREGRSWAFPDAPIDFHDAKGVVEQILSALSIQGARFVPVERSPYHPRATAAIVRADLELGTIGEVHPKVARKLDVPSGVFLFELDAESLFSAGKVVRTFAGLDRYPAVLRDLAVVVPDALPSQEVREVILEVGKPLLEEAVVFDVYSGKPLPPGKKNLAFALRYQSSDRTLTDAEVNQAHQKIIDEVNRRLGGELRKE